MAKLTLFTMPPSHFCEKARWAIDLLARTYREERHAPIFHRSALKKIGAGPTVPALVLENNKVLRESKEIMRWVDDQLSNENKIFPTDAVQGPLVQDFCDRCDRDLAHHVVRFFYRFLPREQFFRLSTEGVDHEEIKKFRWLAAPTRFFFNQRLKINNDNFEDAIRQIDKFYDAVDALLSDGRRYLFCDRPTAADLTFCSLAANTVLVPEFGGSKLMFDEAPTEMRLEVERWRKTRVGTYIQAFYKRFRKWQIP